MSYFDYFVAEDFVPIAGTFPLGNKDQWIFYDDVTKSVIPSQS